MASTNGKARVFVKTQPELAAVFGADDQRTIHRWLQRGAPAKTAKGYDLAAWVHWWAEYKGLGKGQSDSMSGADADRRYKLARATREELTARKMLGQLVNAKDVQADRLELVTCFASTLDRLPAELSSRLAGKRPSEQRRIITEYCEAVRAELTSE